MMLISHYGENAEKFLASEMDRIRSGFEVKDISIRFLGSSDSKSSVSELFTLGSDCIYERTAYTPAPYATFNPDVEQSMSVVDRVHMGIDIWPIMLVSHEAWDFEWLLVVFFKSPCGNWCRDHILASELNDCGDYRRGFVELVKGGAKVRSLSKMAEALGFWIDFNNPPVFVDDERVA